LHFTFLVTGGRQACRIDYESEDIPMMWGYGFGWGSMFLMSLGGILWIALLIVLAWAALRWLNRKASTAAPPTSGPSAMEILQQRYARGEIDTATFEQMRERLEASDARRQQYGNQPITSGR